MLKAILFDLDGTLINSEHFYMEGWNEVLAEVGAQLTFEDWVNNYMGTSLHQNALALKVKYGLSAPVEELVARRQVLNAGRFKATDVELMPFAAENLEFYRHKGLRMTIATSSQRPDVDAIFERNGLGHFFEFMVTRNDVENGKPHPEGYLKCLEKLGIEKHECVVFEDTDIGIAAAKAAGLVCYAIQSNIADHAKLYTADQIFTDLNQAKEHLLKNNLL